MNHALLMLGILFAITVSARAQGIPQAIDCRAAIDASVQSPKLESIVDKRELEHTVLFVLDDPYVQKVIKQVAQQLANQPVTASDPKTDSAQMIRAFRKALDSSLPRFTYSPSGSPEEQNTARIIFGNWIMNMPSDMMMACFHPLQSLIQARVPRVEAVAAAAAHTRKEQQEKKAAQRAKNAAQQAALVEQDQARGYKPTSIAALQLDGRDLAARSARLSITGIYTHEGHLRFLYPNNLALQAALQGAGIPKRILLSTGNAERAFRETLLECESQSLGIDMSGGCSVTVLGHASMCTVTNGFGASHEELCVAVEDGRRTLAAS